MGSSLFHQLSREEYNKLSLAEKLEYMQQLMAELQAKMEETRAQIEQTKKLVSNGRPPQD